MTGVHPSPRLAWWRESMLRNRVDWYRHVRGDPAMRKHSRRAPLPHELPTHAPPRLPPAVAIWLAEEANFRTDPSTVDYAACQACGHPIGFGETVGVPTPADERVQRICWTCLVTIFLYRGILHPADAEWPGQLGHGSFEPRFAVLDAALDGDRRPYGPSQAALRAAEP